MADTISIATATEFIGTAFEPLAGWGEDADVVRHVATLGWRLPSVPDRFLELRDSAAALMDALGDLIAADVAGQPGPIAAAAAEVGVKLTVVLGNIGDLPDALNAQLPAAFLAESGIAGQIEKRLLDSVLVDGITRSSQAVRSALLALGIIQEDKVAADPAKHQPAFLLKQVHLDRLGLLVTDQRELLRRVYGWGTPDIDETRLFEVVREVGYGVLSGAVVRTPSSAFVDAISPPGVPTTPAEVGSMLEVPLFGLGFPPLSIGVVPAPKANPSDNQALAFRLLGGSVPSITVPAGIVTFSLESDLALDTGVGLLLSPDSAPTVIANVEGAGVPAAPGRVSVQVRRTPAEFPFVVFSFGEGSELSIRSYFLELALDTAPSDVAVQAGVEGGVLTVSLGSADGFLRSVVPAGALRVEFDLGVGWSKRRGVFLTGSAGLETLIVLNLTLGPVFLEAIRLALRVDGEGLLARAGVSVAVTLGPVTGVVEGLGVGTRLRFESGNLGPMDLGVSFEPPVGIGILVDAGVVKGGGFLALEHAIGRYSGTLELSVFSIGVKAFGLLETKFADGSEGYSFVIVIIAEFTPIQLGFGFTLLGVGGMIGINRSLNERGLSDAVRTGSLEHLLFPRNPVRDAPAIIHDLATVFPAAKGHYVFGPMAKFGWGTPTLISADLGIVIEFPGPRLAVLGVVRMLLPRPDFALLSLQMAVAGILDFPGKRFSLDASLYDSHVAGYQVSGDMAFRLGFGNNAAFLLSVGGFNPGFDAPPGVPELRRAAVDLGVNGNPSLVASGYFALTSNTAQIGASLELRASGFGIRLHGWLGFDVLFVFSPFSFTASISAGVRVSFHGVGFGLTLHGSLSGPTPWIFKGKVCVSVLWWDACLPIEIKFGRREPAKLPQIDPWLGHRDDADGRITVRGLREAIVDSRSWSGSNPPAGFSVVSLAAAATDAGTPIDPLGAATLRQKVVPLNQKIEKFGEYQPRDHDEFLLSSVEMNGQLVEEIEPVEDDFAPGHFLELSNAEKLSMDSYVPMEAGFSIAPDRIGLGSAGSKVLEYETKYINAAGQVFDNQPVFRLTALQLAGLLRRSASALKGARRSGVQRYVVPGKPKKVTFGPKQYAVVDACSSIQNTAISAGGSQVKTLLALRSHVAANPADRGRFAVVPSYAVRAP